ncbi:type II toxin-antitoxin system prevent-host-death family antitoxin [bacterium]|nr:type II toxin-antitoxin system prevent-host-death family antitoxin [bacterium]
MVYIGTYDAKTNLPGLLKKVAKGEVITITKHGQPVAMLVPPRGQENGDFSPMIQKLKSLRQKNKLKGFSLKKLINEGRR